MTLSTLCNTVRTRLPLSFGRIMYFRLPIMPLFQLRHLNKYRFLPNWDV